MSLAIFILFSLSVFYMAFEQYRSEAEWDRKMLELSNRINDLVKQRNDALERERDTHEAFQHNLSVLHEKNLLIRQLRQRISSAERKNHQTHRPYLP